ncbi:MAG: tyrosine-type recombinase/integrase [Firmicutes bacterium]|nr:tyrosine-type recombinase/integrase [Bacillota bacterium]
MKYQDELYMKLEKQSNEIIAKLPGFAKKFFNHIKGQGMSPRTKLQYAYDMQRFFKFLENSAGFKDTNFTSCTAAEVMDKLTVEDIQEYVDTLEYYTVVNSDGDEEQRLASPSIKARRISSLRSFYKYYFKIGDIENNLADKMDLPKIPDKNISVMDKGQVTRILEAVKDTEGLSGLDLSRHERLISRDYAIMMLFFGTGIRVSELVGVNLLDIDFFNASLLVTRKGGDEDEVYFGQEVQDALSDYMENGRDWLLGKNAREPAFFLSTQHKRISVRSVEMLIKGYAQKAGINMKVTPHALRRTFGTNLYEQTGDIYLVADSLHHSSVETTKKHYARMSKDHKRIAAKTSSTLLEPDEKRPRKKK